MLNVIDRIWSFEFALVPCLIAYLVFDAPILFRRLTRKIYVPIYFSLFPFGYSDELYARYFDEDDMYVLGGPFPKEERDHARIRIIAISVLSLVLTMALSPFLAALFSYYLLTEMQFTQFFWFLIVVKGALLLVSLYNLKWKYRVTDVVPMPILSLIYFSYWALLIYFLAVAFDWISIADVEGGFRGVLRGVIDYLVLKIGIGIILTSVIGFFVSWKMTSQTPRQRYDEL